MNKGFTLLELMVAIIIIGVLTAIAVPIYQTQIEQSRLENVRGDMMRLTHHLERKHKTFKNAHNQLKPEDLQHEYYEIQILRNDHNGYELWAQPNRNNRRGKYSMYFVSTSGVYLKCLRDYFIANSVNPLKRLDLTEQENQINIV